MTEDEASALNRMSARLAAMQLAVTWLLYRDLKLADDPDTLADTLLSKTEEAADSASGKSEDFREAFVEEFALLLDRARQLLSGSS